MFCTNCGKELGQEDKFCAYCGKPAPFVPMFKQESKEEQPRKPILDIDWNLDGYPRQEKKKKTEDIDFNWNSVIGNKQFKPIEVERIEKEDESQNGIFILPELQIDEREPEDKFNFFESIKEPEIKAEPENEEAALTIDELEAELFGLYEEDKNPKNDQETIIFDKEKLEERKDKFYTFTQKQNAFSELLEKEKERLVEMGGEDILTKIEEKKSEVKKDQTTFVGVALPTQPLTVDLKGDKIDSPFPEPEKSKPIESKSSQLTPEEKVKLRYSDIFPRDLVSSDSDNICSDGEEVKEEVKKDEKKESVAGKLDALYQDVDEEEPKKKGGFGKFILALLIIIIVLEGAILAIKFLAPESEIAKWADDMIIKVVELFDGSSSQNDDALEGEQADFKTYMNKIVTNEALETTTIGGMTYTEEFSYDDVKTPAFEEVKKADKFVDATWFEDSKGNSFTYGQIIARTVAKYYDAWQSVNQDESLLSINSVEIGEILKGEEGFYVLDKVTYANADGTDTIKYQSIHLKTSDNAMIISELKEETLNG